MLKRIALAGLTAAVLASGAALAQDKPVELKFAHWLPAQHPLQPLGFEVWAKSVEAASKGSIKVTLYPAQQLGKAPDHYDMARDGIADVAWINPGYQPGRFPVIAAGELPFLISNAKAGSAALDKWYRKYSEKEMKDVKVCLTHLHDPGALHSKKAITSPEQIKGMKIRPAHATMAKFVTLLGGTNVQVSAPEAREALEKGVADALTFPWNSILIFGIDKAVTHHLDIPFYVTTFAWVMNKDTYGKMSAAQKKVIDEHCTTEWAEKVASGWADNEASGKEKLSTMAGHTLVKVTAADVAAWRKAAEPLRTSWADEVKKAGLDPAAVMKELDDELKARKSQY
ncbi:MAG: C4-dicarboxylate transporter [Alphaproteobacteria bacterium]|jgi:TRAP-type C4-dicarboxylate transport system substrate-binding protein|nr:C4-dicarboxylate transporter [Alphaproteobacteria bacterium]